MSADFLLPTDEQIKCERSARRRQLASASPLRNPPPATVALLVTECEEHRRRIMAVLRDGVPILPCSNQNFSALLTGNADGFMLPPLARLFDAAVALDVGDAPELPGEPQTGRDAVALLNSLMEWCRAKQQPAPAALESTPEQSPAKSKRGGGRKPLEESSPLNANLYSLVCREHRDGEEHVDTVKRLTQRRDIVTLAGKVGVEINTKLVRKALAWDSQRLYRLRQKSPDNETDGTPLLDEDDLRG